MKARHFVVLLVAILAATLCGAASAEGQAVVCEANGYKVSLEIPDAWESMAEGGEVQSDGSVLIGQWGVFSADDDLTMVMMTAADIWQGMTSEQRQECGLRTKGDCDTLPDTAFGKTFQSQFSAAIGADIPYEDIGGIWYLKYVGVYESTGKDGRAVSADRIYFSCIRDGIQYNISFFYPDFDARAEAEMVAVMESIRYAAKTEYAFDLFSIDMPENLVVFTEETVDDESLYTGIFQGIQEDIRALFEPDSYLYLLAYEPVNAYSFDIVVLPSADWYDLNAASEDEIEKVILPQYTDEFESGSKTVYNSGSCLLGDQTYLFFRRCANEGGGKRYDIQYYTMIQVKGQLYGVAISVDSFDAQLTDEAARQVTEAIGSMTYFGTEGTRVTNVDDGYAMTVQVPITWVNLGELDTEREEDDDSAHWGAIEDGVRSMVYLEADPYWSEMTSAQKSEEGFLTKYDCEMIPGTELGDGYFNAFKGGGNDTEYLEYGGVWYIRHDVAVEGAPGQVMPCISLFMTIHEGTRFSLTFIYDAFTPECEAEMNRIMESVTYQEME